MRTVENTGGKECGELAVGMMSPSGGIDEYDEHFAENGKDWWKWEWEDG